MPEITTLPNATSLNLLTDKAVVQQGGVLKNAAPSLFQARVPAPDPIASDSAIDLTTADGIEISITGTDDIESISLQENRVVWLKFADTLKIVHDGSAIYGLNGNSTQVAAGDKVRVVGLASGVKIESLVRASQPTYDLGNYPDPGTGVESDPVGGQIGTLIFGGMYFAPEAGRDRRQAFAVETGIGAATYTEVTQLGFSDAENLFGGSDLVYFSFAFFVPTGRKWQHYDVGDGGGTIGQLSGIEL